MGFDSPLVTYSPAADIEPASVYHRLFFASERLDAATAATYVLRQDSTGLLASGASAGLCVFYLDSADFTAGSKTAYLRTQLLTLVNATTPAADFTLGLYPVTACAGAATAVSITLGAVVAGSTCVVSAPLANSLTYVAGSDFAFPAAGFFCLGLVGSANMAANSSVVVRGVLARRAV